MRLTSWLFAMPTWHLRTLLQSGKVQHTIQLFLIRACCGRDGWLLGDRGYALTPYMMTPFHPDKVVTSGEKKYQKSHTKTRNVIERCFGVLKQRFRCLDFSGGATQFSPSRCCNIILATAVLHNMCILDKTQLPEDLRVMQGHDNDEVSTEPPSSESGTAMRQKLICDVFS